jgi:hypothetical protein
MRLLEKAGAWLTLLSNVDKNGVPFSPIIGLKSR